MTKDESTLFEEASDETAGGDADIGPPSWLPPVSPRSEGDSCVSFLSEREAKREILRQRARKAMIENEIFVGRYVLRIDVDAAAVDAAARITNALYSLADRLSGPLSLEDEEVKVRKILTEEIGSVCALLSDGFVSLGENDDSDNAIASIDYS